MATYINGKQSKICLHGNILKVQNMLAKLFYNFIKTLFRVPKLEDPLHHVKYRKYFVKISVYWNLVSGIFLNVYFLDDSRDEIISKHVLESTIQLGNVRCIAYCP